MSVSVICALIKSKQVNAYSAGVEEAHWMSLHTRRVTGGVHLLETRHAAGICFFFFP